MTPDANDLCVFAVKRGNIEGRLDINFNLPKYTALVAELRERFGTRLKTIGEIADVICGPFGSAIKNTDYQDSGIPLVRITNITKDGYMNYDDIVYISEELGNSLARTQVSQGDLVVSQRGSLGQCAIVDDKFEKLNISANIIAIKNVREVSVAFLHDYFLSKIGQTLLERSVSGQVQQKVTTQDIADLLIPIGCDEEKLSSYISNANRKHDKKSTQIDYLVHQTSNYVLEKIGISIPSTNASLSFAVRLRNIMHDGPFSTEYYHPERLNAIMAMQTEDAPSVRCLSDIVEFCRETTIPTEDAQYLGLAGVESQTGELSGIAEEASGQAYVYHKGDVLYGRLRPYLNKVLFAESDGICSTEFHVMRMKDESEALPEYLAAIMRSDLILMQTKHMMTGNTHPRISNDDVKALYIPVPDISIQETICVELRKSREEARRLKEEVEQEWLEAKAQFERELLGE